MAFNTIIGGAGSCPDLRYPAGDSRRYANCGIRKWVPASSTPATTPAAPAIGTAAATSAADFVSTLTSWWSGNWWIVLLIAGLYFWSRKK